MGDRIHQEKQDDDGHGRQDPLEPLLFIDGLAADNVVRRNGLEIPDQVRKVPLELVEVISRGPEGLPVETVPLLVLKCELEFVERPVLLKDVVGHLVPSQLDVGFPAEEEAFHPFVLEAVFIQFDPDLGCGQAACDKEAKGEHEYNGRVRQGWAISQ